MLRLSLLAATLGAVLAALAPASASSAVPCRDKIYNDWYKDGKIATTYSIACYRDALKHVPTDALTYSSLGDDIRSAMQGALAQWIDQSNPAYRTTGDLPPWPAGADAPRNGEFPFHPAKGVDRALGDDPGLGEGLNVMAGRIRHPAVASSLGL